MIRIRQTARLYRYARGQARFPFRPREAIAAERDRRLRETVAFAAARVPHWRRTFHDAGIAPDAIRTAADLARLPLLTRLEVQQRSLAFAADGIAHPDQLVLLSGGSSAEPLAVRFDLEGLLQSSAHGERERSIHSRHVGRRFGYRETSVISSLSSAVEIQGRVARATHLPRGISIRRQNLSLVDPVEETAARIEAFRPDVIHSYGSWLGEYFRHLDQAGDALLHRPRVVTFSSDGMADTERAFVEERFGLPVYGTYQAIEALKIGFECEKRDGYHLNDDLYPVRIVDAEGRDVPDGEAGEVVISNLVNRATVLLNYRLEDLATRTEEPCACGRTLPRLLALHGRADDWIVGPGGRRVHPQLIRTIFTNEAGIWQYQVTQSAPERFAIDIVGDPVEGRPAMIARITSRLRESLGPSVDVTIRFVDRLERTPRGKLRPVRSYRT